MAVWLHGYFTSFLSLNFDYDILPTIEGTLTSSEKPEGTMKEKGSFVTVLVGFFAAAGLFMMARMIVINRDWMTAILLIAGISFAYSSFDSIAKARGVIIPVLLEAAYFGLVVWISYTRYSAIPLVDAVLASVGVVFIVLFSFLLYRKKKSEEKK